MNNPNGLTISQILDLIESVDGVKEQEKIEAKIKAFYRFIKWSDKDYEEYSNLLDNLKKIRKKKKENTKELGLALEDLAKFIFNKSFFYKVYPNKRTATNEIDEFVLLSDKGKQALKDYGFSRELLLTDENCFLCECKNYKKKVGSTWVGKFNTLLDTCGNSKFGIIFSYHGLSGKENNWYDAHGLVKTIYRMSKEGSPRLIIDFNINDFEKLLDRNNNIFKLIEAKKAAIISNIKSEKLIYEMHDGNEEVKNIYNEIK